MTLLPLRPGLAISVVIAVAVGCTGVPYSGQDQKATPQAPGTSPSDSQTPGGIHPIAAFLGTARPGDSIYLTLPESGSRVQIAAHREYFAASGRYCRRYDVVSTNSTTTVSSGLGCRNERGVWELEPLLVNPNDVNAPQRLPPARSTTP